MGNPSPPPPPPRPPTPPPPRPPTPPPPRPPKIDSLAGHMTPWWLRADEAMLIWWFDFMISLEDPGDPVPQRGQFPCEADVRLFDCSPLEVLFTSCFFLDSNSSCLVILLAALTRVTTFGFAMISPALGFPTSSHPKPGCCQTNLLSPPLSTSVSSTRACPVIHCMRCVGPFPLSKG